jgi:hypothetical protein
MPDSGRRSKNLQFLPKLGAGNIFITLLTEGLYDGTKAHGGRPRKRLQDLTSGFGGTCRDTKLATQ